jgi:hypothetical protein
MDGVYFLLNQKIKKLRLRLFDVKWFLSKNIFREVIFPENVFDMFSIDHILRCLLRVRKNIYIFIKSY